MKRFPLSKLTFLLATLLVLTLMTTQVASAASGRVTKGDAEAILHA